MANSIEICDLRNIKKLSFTIPDRGVWLLTAPNGAGKTSLLACLRRIGHPNAFQLHFPSSLRSDRLDNHARGKVTYEINGETVEYAYRGERWTPRPRSNSDLFSKLGYSSVTYIGATAERITPRPEDFETKNVRSANQHVIKAANQIFETDKFNALRTINLTRGVGNDAFVLSIPGPPLTYHSEKHFSLGELCVLKLLRLLTQLNNNSMIIVDELEMALHPKAQVNLLRYIEEQAKAKSLTVVFSTHSVTLLKAVSREKIIYLEKLGNGEIEARFGCYPTYAIGNIASNEETLPDVMLYVEDVFARDMLISFFEMFANERFSNPTERPSIKVVPVGGFKEVVAFLERNRSVLPDWVSQRAVLDADVSSETLKAWQRNSNHAQLAKFELMKRIVNFLPFTPEIGMIEFIRDHCSEFETSLRTRFKDHQLHISAIIRSFDDDLQGASRRTEAKRVTDALTNYLRERTQKNVDLIREILCDTFAVESWGLYRSRFFQLFGPMI